MIDDLVGKVVKIKLGKDVLDGVVIETETYTDGKRHKVQLTKSEYVLWVDQCTILEAVDLVRPYKSRPDWIPADVILGMGDVLAWGKGKYPNNDWKTMDPEMHLAACQRHLLKHAKGEVNDDESGMNHLYHSLVRLAFYTHLTCGAGK